MSDNRRAFGEAPLSVLTQAKKTTWRERKREHQVTCAECGHSLLASLNFLRHLAYERRTYVCRECREKGQREVNQAILAVSSRKAELKKSKKVK